MKYCVILLFFGVAAQLDASVIQPTNDTEMVERDNKRVSRSAQDRSEEEGKHRVDNTRDKVESESDSAKNLRRSDDGPDGNKVLAFGLDTGVADTKNAIVQAISDAFGGLVQSQHARSNTKGDKKPLSLELRSESILQTLENFLRSPKVKKITRDLAKKAAIIYRAIEKEL
ncbi:uncharacterized protein LOC133532728 [Cydia pomonella]|uniref:uncharacterized protein LOC133532728 n=1 Tax=Cydia pomonella TaxID=82600 RepID=UPI002ADE8E5A|nr:uncharacterized protein LOC133532728 [Cydia pomonella]